MAYADKSDEACPTVYPSFFSFLLFLFFYFLLSRSLSLSRTILPGLTRSSSSSSSSLWSRLIPPTLLFPKAMFFFFFVVPSLFLIAPPFLLVFHGGRIGRQYALFLFILGGLSHLPFFLPLNGSHFSSRSRLADLIFLLRLSSWFFFTTSAVLPLPFFLLLSIASPPLLPAIFLLSLFLTNCFPLYSSFHDLLPFLSSSWRSVDFYLPSDLVSRPLLRLQPNGWIQSPSTLSYASWSSTTSEPWDLLLFLSSFSHHVLLCSQLNGVTNASRYLPFFSSSAAATDRCLLSSPLLVFLSLARFSLFIADFFLLSSPLYSGWFLFLFDLIFFSSFLRGCHLPLFLSSSRTFCSSRIGRL